jgi:predicted GNAT family acetyltransferase
MTTEGPPAPDAPEELVDNAEDGRFELYRHTELVGWLYYTHLRPNRYALRHTEVEVSHQHQGVAGTMVRRVLEEIRSRKGTITAICPFVVDFVSRTSTYADLIDARYPGYPDRAAAEAAASQAGGWSRVGAGGDSDRESGGGARPT